MSISKHEIADLEQDDSAGECKHPNPCPLHDVGEALDALEQAQLGPGEMHDRGCPTTVLNGSRQHDAKVALIAGAIYW
jgi:hypothetical protein